MIFQHTWQAVLDGSKTQTRRVIKPGEQFAQYDEWEERLMYPHFVERHGKTVYSTFKTYAVQPGRGKPAIWWRNIAGVLQTTYDAECPESLRTWDASALRYDGWQQARIRITNIAREDVRQISYEDACAEGFQDPYHHVADTIYGGFMKTWCKMHDKKAVWQFDPQRVDYWINTGKRRELVGWQTVVEIINARPAEYYQAWKLCFELVKE